MKNIFIVEYIFKYSQYLSDNYNINNIVLSILTKYLLLLYVGKIINSGIISCL